MKASDIRPFDLSEVFQDELTNRIFNMAATPKGVKVSEIEKLAGELGLRSMDKLIAQKILTTDESGWLKYQTDSWALTSPEEALKQVSFGPKHFDESLVGTDGACISHLTGNLRKSDLPKLKKLIKDFAKATCDLKNAEESEKDGECVFFVDLVYSLYNGEELKK